MKSCPKFVTLFSAVTLAVGSAIASMAADSPKAAAKKTPWKISGQLEEA